MSWQFEITSLLNLEEIIGTFLLLVRYALKCIEKVLLSPLHSEAWGQLEREGVWMRMPLFGFRALAILIHCGESALQIMRENYSFLQINRLP